MLLGPKTGENVRGIVDEEPENGTRSFYTPTESIRINSTQKGRPVRESYHCVSELVT